MSVITNEDLVRLFSYFARYPDTTSQRQDELMHIQSKCNELFAKDYNLSIISNRQGELCATYPLDLVILESEKDPESATGTVKYVKRTKIFSSLGSSDEGEDKSSSSSLLEGISGGECVPSPLMSSPIFSNNPSSSISEGDEGSRSILTSSMGVGNEDEKAKNDGIKLEPMFQRSRFARVRTRFPVPVILWNGKNICRSSTLSQKLEYMLQAAHNTLVRSSDVPPDMMTRSHMESLRNRDIVTIKQLGVKYILDLMMENKKKKFGFTVCSSEKVDMHERYATFTIASIPYPGVEFFQEFNQRKHVAHDLHFDWGKYEDVVELKLDDPIPASNIISWRDYKTWDLVLLTKNYLRLMLYQLSDPAPDAGLLVHCISGWDRTPLFISLLRITMWADKQIHQSLHVEELLYLTVAYDWLLFSHQLYDRASRGEDIFYFCFYFLQFIHSPEFSVPVDLTPPPPTSPHASPPTPTPPPSEIHLTPAILPTSPTLIPISPRLPLHEEPACFEQERKEAADSDSNFSNFSNSIKKTPSLESFSNLSAKLNGSSNSLPNPRRTPPQEPRLSALSSSFTETPPTPSIPISKKGEAETIPSGLASSPSPSAISTSFSMISSTPHSYKTSTFVHASASGTRATPSPSLLSTSHSSSSSSSSTHGHSFVRSNGAGVTIPHSHSGHSHSHSHSHSRHSYRETPPMEISHHRGNGASSRKVSDSCDPVDCTCGSWQMVSEFSFSDKSHPHPHLLQTQTPPSTTTDDSDDDSTDSSSHFDPVDADFTGSSWENDGVFPQDMELGGGGGGGGGGERRSHPRHPLPSSSSSTSTPSSSSSSSSSRMYRSGSSSRLPPFHPLAAALPPSSDVKVPAQLPNEALRYPPDSNSNFGGKTDAHANGKDWNSNFGGKADAQPVALADAEEPKPEPGTRAARLSELQHMGMQLYDQCCRAQAGNWTFLARFLPRFV